jgi:hypothetical protein
MDGFDILGATLADQYIVLRVKNIDRARLKAKLGGSTGQLASSVVTMVDVSAKAALDAALPVAVSKARDYGIELEAYASNVPPNMSKRSISEFWPGLLLGGVLGGSGLLIATLVGKLFKR